MSKTNVQSEVRSSSTDPAAPPAQPATPRVQHAAHVAQLAAVGHGARHGGRPERDGVRRVRRHGGDPGEEQRRKGFQAAAPRDRVDGAAHRSGDEEEREHGVKAAEGPARPSTAREEQQLVVREGIEPRGGIEETLACTEDGGAAAPIADSLTAAASASGFSPRLSVVEISGVCAHCQKAA